MNKSNQINLSNPHRLLAPRPVFLLGSLSRKNQPNIIPLTNIVQISYEPSEILVCIYNQWETAKNLGETKNCSISPLYERDIENGWKLGAKYSGWKPENSAGKLNSISRKFNTDKESGIPYLKDSYPVLFCRVTKQIAHNGDHNLFVLKPYSYISQNGSRSNDVECPVISDIVFQVTQGVFGVSLKKIISLAYYNEKT